MEKKKNERMEKHTIESGMKGMNKVRQLLHPLWAGVDLQTNLSVLFDACNGCQKKNNIDQIIEDRMKKERELVKQKREKTIQIIV
jgi:hypothetical protein